MMSSGLPLLTAEEHELDYTRTPEPPNTRPGWACIERAYSSGNSREASTPVWFWARRRDGAPLVLPDREVAPLKAENAKLEACLHEAVNQNEELRQQLASTKAQLELVRSANAGQAGGPPAGRRSRSEE